MQTYSASLKTLPKGIAAGKVLPALSVRNEVALLTGGFDKHYTFGLAVALASRGVRLDVVGGDDVDSPEMHNTPELNFLNLRGSKQETSLIAKISRVLVYYARLIRYAVVAEPRIFHVLWNNKFESFDRTFLMLYYKLLGKKLVFTAHNVNAGKRDANDTPLNRSTLKVQYRLSDHIFVHTEQMKRELTREFGIDEGAVSVIPYGINNSVPDAGLSPAEAKKQLGLSGREKTMLFFGMIRPYKGLEYLVRAFQQLAANHPEYRLIIAGQPIKGTELYLSEIQSAIDNDPHRNQVIQKIRYIPDEETELYFKAADIAVLPYTHIFQSGVLFLSYSFGLPVIATDVGSLRDDIVAGETGYVCKPRDAVDLAEAIETYFESDLFKNLDHRREAIRDFASAKHSWDIVGEITENVYARLLEPRKQS